MNELWISEMANPKALYIFVDEGGNLDFSPNGTKYFTLTSVTRFRPFQLDQELGNLRFDLIEDGLELERFHASEDRQPIRDRVFAAIKPRLSSLRIDSVVVEKCKTGPSLRENRRFYPEMLSYLLRYVINGMNPQKWSEFIIITDTIPVKKKREVITKSVKTTLSKLLPNDVPHRILHHDSRSCYGLQIADYANWAIYRKWDRTDTRSYYLIQRSIRSEFDIFACGSTAWY